MTLEALRIVLLFILFVGSVFILLTTLANIKLTKEKRDERKSRLGEQTMVAPPVASTHLASID